ncbi:MAG TPA: hypothetical protein O0X34_02635 [Methanocorpusculum sp.]|nr:hypothetical protein [Methanocorpusculum sp.]HJK73878.1 hypothetical protein [Methanocorpusculum sp.]HJK75127.1 hypothetical protein [Methanocorpusculum sp.]HJK83972.1 hypothetical protein [Methanocorpusculum sp.]
MNKKKIIKFVSILLTLLLVTALFQPVMAGSPDNYGLEENANTNNPQPRVVWAAPIFVSVGPQIGAYVSAGAAIIGGLLTGASAYLIINNLESQVQSGSVEKTVSGTETTYVLKSEYQSQFGANPQEDAYYDTVAALLSEATGEGWEKIKNETPKLRLITAYSQYQSYATTEERDQLGIYFKDKKSGKHHIISYDRPMNLQEATAYMVNALNTNTVGRGDSGNGHVLTINQAAAERLCEAVSLARGGSGFVTASPNEDPVVSGHPQVRHCHPRNLDGTQMRDLNGDSPHCHYLVYPMNLAGSMSV